MPGRIRRKGLSRGAFTRRARLVNGRGQTFARGATYMKVDSKLSAEPAKVRVVAMWAVLAILGFTSLKMLAWLLAFRPLALDYSVLWTGDALPLIIRPGFTTSRMMSQRTPATANVHVGPFVYPPSSLGPCTLWNASLLAGLWPLAARYRLAVRLVRRSSRREVVGRPVSIGHLRSLARPDMLLVSGLTIGGLTLLRRRALAGVLFGCAAAVKPQFLVFVPVALAAVGGWRIIVWAGLTVATLVLASVAVWGLNVWREWLVALPAYQRLVEANPPLVGPSVTPYAWLIEHGLHGAWAYLLIPPVIVGVWLTFRGTERLGERTLALFGGNAAGHSPRRTELRSDAHRPRSGNFPHPRLRPPMAGLSGLRPACRPRIGHEGTGARPAAIALAGWASLGPPHQSSASAQNRPPPRS